MAISALKLNENNRKVLYSERIELLDRYTTCPVVYYEDLQTRSLEEEEFNVVRRLLEGIDWVAVKVIKRDSVRMKYFTNRSPEAHYDDESILDELLANIPFPLSENFEYSNRWNAVSQIIEILGKK